MYGGASDPREWCFQSEYAEAEDEIHDLEDGHWLDEAIERDGEPVEEELGPEESMEACPYLIYKVVSWRIKEQEW